MAGGNARYVRYIVFAIFVSALSPFAFAAQNQLLSIHPSAPANQSQTLILFYYVSHSKYEGVNIDGQALRESWAQSPSKQQHAASGESSNKAPAYQSSDAKQHPMAMTPADPGWNDLVGIAPGPRVNATFVTLARNSDVWDIAKSIRHVEDRFNRRYNYDWVFLNDKPFDATFKKVTSSLVSGNTFYGLIPTEHWSFPEWIDQDKAKKVREDMAERKIIYGDSVSYRHMCRFESGFFFRHPLMMNYEYYWRVEPSIELYCDIHYDPFRVMVEQGKKYSFVLSLYEYKETISTLWDSTKKFIANHPEHIAEDNSMKFLSDDGGNTYNLCHFVCPLPTLYVACRHIHFTLC